MSLTLKINGMTASLEGVRATPLPSILPERVKPHHTAGRRRPRALGRAVDTSRTAVQQAHSNDQPVLLMNDHPADYHQRPAHRTGRNRYSAVATAIANTVFQLTGARLRHLPMTSDHVKAAMKA